jgi:hypothetical protein
VRWSFPALGEPGRVGRRRLPGLSSTTRRTGRLPATARPPGAALLLAHGAMNDVKAMLQSRDWSGAATARVADGLARAALPLETDWVRQFLLQRDDVAGDLSILTSPSAAASAAVLTGVFHTNAHMRGGRAFSEQSLTANCLLIPSLTLGDATVGLVVLKEGRSCDESRTEEEDVELSELLDCVIPPGTAAVAEHEYSIGRFWYNNRTGEMLWTSRLMPGECDYTVAALSFMARSSGGPDLPATSASWTRPTTRVLWWPPVRNAAGTAFPHRCDVSEKLTAVLDAELFERGEYERSILVANYVGSAVRTACARCSARELLRTAAMGASEVRLASCACRHEALVAATAALGFAHFRRNLQNSSCGLWAGSAEEVSRLIGRPGPLVAAAQTLCISLEFDADADLCAKLLALAVGQCVLLASLPRQVVGGSRWNRICSGGLAADAGHGEGWPEGGLLDVDLSPVMGADWGGTEDDWTSVRLSVDSSRVGAPLDSGRPVPAGESAFTDGGGSECAKRREAVAEARRERNRAAAARSNARRKAAHNALTDSLAAVKKRATELQGVEMHLRARNVELRSQWEESQAAWESSSCFVL